MKIGTGTKVHQPCFIGSEVEIGERCRIQAFSYIPDHVVIGDDVFIGPGVVFCNDKYPPSHGAWKEAAYTTVHDKAVIGAGAIIMPSLWLGEGCKIGAGAVVTKDVSPYTVVMGSPAREIRSDW